MPTSVLESFKLFELIKPNKATSAGFNIILLKQICQGKKPACL